MRSIRAEAGLRHHVGVYLWVMLCGLCPGIVLADTLVCRDGREITGEVKEEAGGYTVKLRAGEIFLNKNDVREWIKEKKTATPQTPVKPVEPVTPVAPAPPIAPSRRTRISEAQADPAKRDEALKRWMKQGEEALEASEFTAARDRFCDLTIVDPKNARAFHGLGLAYLGLKDLPKARESLGMAVKILCPAEDGKGLERPLVMNFALVEIAGNNRMRAAMIVGGYMRTASGDVDEEMLNTLGLALNNADFAARQAQLFPELADLYAGLNARLEATRPGLKRWGAAWKSPNEVAKLMAQWRKDEAALSALVATAHANWENMKARYDRLKKDQEIARRFGASSVAGMSGHRTMYERALALYEESMAACNALDEQTVRPPFPWTLVASPMDRLKAPPQAVAKVEPDQVAPAPRKRKGPKPPPAEDPEIIAAPAMVQEQRQLLPPPKVPGKHMVVRMSAAIPVAPICLLPAHRRSKAPARSR